VSEENWRMAKNARQKARAKAKRKANPARKKAKKTKSRNKRRSGTMKGSIKSVRGSGGYFGDFGAGLGRDAGNWVSKIFGFGDYNIKQNSLMSGNSGPPVFGSGSTEIKHREYLQDITSSVAFNIQGFPINPGIEGTFPWLSVIAQNFEVYELLGLVFEYKATSAIAVNSTNTALGTVILSTEYDAINPPFASKQEMEAHEFTVATSPACSVIHGIECAPRTGVLDRAYLRSAPNPSGTDIRMYDKGTFYIATQGMQAASVIGELWVSYHVRLIQPQLVYQPSALGYLHLRSENSSTGVFSTNFSVVSGSLPYALHSTTGLILDEGQYIVASWLSSGSAGATFTGTATLSGTMSYLDIFTNTSGVSTYGNVYSVATGNGNATGVMMVSASGPNGIIDFNCGSGVTWVDTLVLQVPIGVSFKIETLDQRLAKMEALVANLRIKPEKDFVEVKREDTPRPGWLR